MGKSKPNHLDSTLPTEIVALKGECACFRSKRNTQVINVRKNDF